ncbi:MULTISPECIES: pyridoxamine 5'-phosphate oxidase family protein [unclassified Arthrobacter]|uniref:pyridoxamine 5'-phosphate oxidase family protein n=1 Tax=unclassified Arthrobacter TaxID=235627 RepID=UPI001E41737E|nr:MULTISPECIES: pyridoxamine 5'-phosphate oxidase family protein [unclassified Arthrobacter]MCC9146012.1 pyridoxamine 5'-phosphate oxidase family protein [Arthrobacter sp. zg-Y919]MDK1277241.1 pyridoxamine 5'-phosphate oxidase family protein [Arthrobacter sp. zg.Y919]MDM7990622.1 pyridoxamine 5'-phosphate oxidase family protein [Arthrobacter sp. zg-Y877]WIB03755.1 pyridoxamine 5'-phosphate oxidase family protein [Arthrobacter sp. zg-Y919]
MSTEELPPVVELSAEQSWKYLENTHHGRLAVSVANRPSIYPINYLAHDGVLLIRTAPGTKLAEMTVNTHVAFEADGIHSAEAWSVVVKGTTRPLETSGEIEAADALPLRPWVRTEKYRYVEIIPESVTGRFFNLGPEPATD